MKSLSCLLAIGLAFLSNQAALASWLIFRGQVHLDAPDSPPIADAEVTVTFHGHENGIHEYRLDRTVAATTDAQGQFSVSLKLSDYRYRWTHTTITVGETEVSKEIIVVGSCLNDDQGGCTGVKQISVPRTASTLRGALPPLTKL